MMVNLDPSGRKVVALPDAAMDLSMAFIGAEGGMGSLAFELEKVCFLAMRMVSTGEGRVVGVKDSVDFESLAVRLRFIVLV
mmetsp:Transcript_8393/g.12708  ORF Transcript_8393/g.12708 Transcript_8393/m.12708 type:complete len:81 (-) Transcript_8393:193-435(-)